MRATFFRQFKGFTLDLSFQTSDSMIALFGPSGSGKSITLKMIAGMIEPTHGSFKLNDETLSLLPAYKRECGFVFQDLALFPHLNVWKNISSSQNFDQPLAQELLEKFSLSHLKNKSIDELSGGQKQRVAIIRALASHPQILLLDEPFSFLDLATKKVVLHEINSFCKSRSVPAILVTHDMEDVNSFADTCFLIQDGKIHREITTSFEPLEHAYD